MHETDGLTLGTLIDLFDTFPALGDKTAFVNRTGVRRVVVSYQKNLPPLCQR